MTKRFFFATIFLALSNLAFSQDTLQMIDGKKIVVTSVTIGDDEISYQKPNSSVVRSKRSFRVFSVLYRDGSEKIVFQPDTLDPMEFKTEEMRMFIKGEQEAKNLYRTRAVPAVGFAVGAGSAYFAIYGLIGPPIYASILSYFSPNIEKQHTFKVSGDAAQSLGIEPGKYLNEVTAKSNITLKKDQVLKVGSKKIKFEKDSDLNAAVEAINSNFKASRVHAANDNGKLKLYKANSTKLISDPAYREGFSKEVRRRNITSGLLGGFIGFSVGFAILNLLND